MEDPEGKWKHVFGVITVMRAINFLKVEFFHMYFVI